MSIIVMRYACTQEDEGRDCYIGTYPDLIKAREIISDYVRGGYYSSRDFFTMEVPDEKVDS